MTIPAGAAAHHPHLDSVRTALVAWVIGGHALLGYSAVGGWPYDEVHEVTFAPATELVLVAVIGPSGLFVIGTFFFVSGLVTERSLQRHGAPTYLRTRAVRLGLPWLVSALLVWPASVWSAYAAAGRPVSFWWVLTHRDPLLDSGSLWFALVLLLYSGAFALLCSGALWRPVLPAPPTVRPAHPGARLAVAVLLIAGSSFLVRLVFPARSGQPGDLHLWQWPQCAGMFVLGIVMARRGWAGHVPDRVRRACGAAALVTLAALPALALATGMRDASQDAGPYLGGWHWQSLGTAIVEAVLVVLGSVWLVGWAEQHPGGARASAWTRGAYVAFVVQGPVLMGLASAMRPLPLPAEVKAPVLAAAAVAVSFGLGRLAVGDRPWRALRRPPRDVRPGTGA